MRFNKLGWHTTKLFKLLSISIAILAIVVLVDITPRDKIENDVAWHSYYCADAFRLCETEKTWDDFSEEYGVTYHYNNPILKFLGNYAFTFGNDVYFSDSSISMEIRKHEYRHVQQYQRDGVLVLAIKYASEYIWGLMNGLSDLEAYNNISYEIDARDTEKYVSPEQELVR